MLCCVIWLQNTDSHPSLVKVEVELHVFASQCRSHWFASFSLCSAIFLSPRAWVTRTDSYEWIRILTSKYFQYSSLFAQTILSAIHLFNRNVFTIKANGNQSVHSYQNLISCFPKIVITVRTAKELLLNENNFFVRKIFRSNHNNLKQWLCDNKVVLLLSLQKRLWLSKMRIE